VVCILIGVVQLFANMIDACKFGLYWPPVLLATLCSST
jgi:hypothetical protein